MKQIDASEKNVIDYIGGEMSAEDAQKFEILMNSDTTLKAKVEEMKATLGELQKWTDQEIAIPTIGTREIESEGHPRMTGRKGRKLHLPNWMKYAAAFLGFVILLQISGLKITQEGNTMMVSLGEPQIHSLNQADVDVLVGEAIANYAQRQNQMFEQFRNDMTTDISEITHKVERIETENQLTVVQLEELFGRSLDKQYVNLESMIKGIEDMQRQELEDSFTSLVEYIENKRVKDQFKLQNAFNEIATAINNQQDQTSALLSSISDEPPILKSY